MVSSKLFRFLLISGLVAVLIIGVAMLSCDKRSSINNSTTGGGKVSTLLMNLSPSHVRMASPDVIDTVIVGVAAIDSSGKALSGVRISLTRFPDMGFLIQPPDTTDASGTAYGIYVCEPGAYDTTTTITITAHAGNITKTGLLSISGPSSYNLLLALTPSQVRLPSPDARDSVSIQIAVMDESGVGISGAHVGLTCHPAIGLLVQPDTTNYQGITYGKYICQPGVYDTTRISAHVGVTTRSALLAISGPSNYTLDLNYNPPVPKLIDHEGDPYTLTAVVVDSTQRGVSGLQVVFSVTNGVGRLTFADTTITVPQTNSEGLAEALFYNTQADEITLPQMANIQVITRSPDNVGFLAASVSIPLRQVHNSLSMQFTQQQVYGDGTSKVIIRAFLRDTDGHGIRGDTVRFTNPTNNGRFGDVGPTDINGMDTTTFTPFGGVGHIDTSMIIAEYQPGSIHVASDTNTILILPIRSIGMINVSLQQQSIEANGSDKAAIFITVQDSTGGLISDGTPVYVNHHGTGSLWSPQVTTTDGQAKDTIYAPSHIPDGVVVDSIFVYGNATDSTVIADTAIIRYNPGHVAQLRFIRPTGPVDLIAGSGQSDSAMVEATDANGNHVDNGTPIQFVKQLATSSLTPSPAPTVTGIATSIYLVGSGIGDDNVKAWAIDTDNPSDTIVTAQPVIYHCLSSSATTLQLSTPNPFIRVGGASTQIIAELQDAYGNRLSQGYSVAFEITVSPGNFVDPLRDPSFSTDPGNYRDTVETNINGQAIVQLYSGRASGTTSIRACTVSETLYVCDEKSLVTISSGPPAYINTGLTFNSQGGSNNDPARFCVVGAWVGDQFSNPVEYGTAVYFSLIPSGVALIDGNALVGAPHLPYWADSTEGMAYTRITYECYQTFEHLRVIASSAGDSGQIVDTSSILILPLYNGTLTCHADPGNLWCDTNACTCTGGPNHNCKDTSTITVTLRDGGLCLIPNTLIEFSATAGYFNLTPAQAYTDSAGQAHILFIIRGCDIPYDPNTNRSYINVTITADVVSNPEVKCTVDVPCNRPPG